MRLNTSIKKLNRQQILQIVNMTMSWCKKYLGMSEYKRNYCTWKLIKNLECNEETGYYDPRNNVIYIYWNNMDNIKDIISTCIHEWTHYQQPILKEYYKWNGTYSKNPYQRKAYYKEHTKLFTCWNEIKIKLV